MQNSHSKKNSYQKVNFGREAHEKLLEGARILYSAVKSTLGPSGHCVIIDNNETMAPLITKDGVTVARSITLRDKMQSAGAELLKEVASKTNELGGDGTTTATILAYSILEEGIKMIYSGRSSIGLKRGIDKATELVIEQLKENSIKIRGKEDIINVGTISANGDRKIGELLAEAIEKVGENGIVTIEPTKSVETTLTVVDGLQIDCGFVSPYFVTNQEKLTTEYYNPYILITNRKITAMADIIPVMEKVSKESRPLLVIADEIEGEALHTLLVNKMKGVVPSVAIKAPSYGDFRSDILGDIAVLTGGTVLDSSSPVATKNVSLKELGTCKKLIVSRNSTTIVGESNNQEITLKVRERVGQISELLSSGRVADELQRNHLTKRLARLSGGVAIIKIGGSTEVEILERKDRVEDALNATFAAVQEGILPGGGCALYYAGIMARLKNEKLYSELKEDEKAGFDVLIKACHAPIKIIIENAGKSPDVILSKLLVNSVFNQIKQEDINKRLGYDAVKHEVGDLIEKGIIDPIKVSRYALEHSSSIVSLILTCDCIVTNEPEKE